MKPCAGRCIGYKGVQALGGDLRWVFQLGGAGLEPRIGGIHCRQWNVLSRCGESQGNWAGDHRKPTSWRHVVENYLRIAGDPSDFGAPDTWLMSVVRSHLTFT